MTIPISSGAIMQGLEMEEVENLVSSSNGLSVDRKLSSSSSHDGLTWLHAMQEPKHRNKIIAGMIVIFVILVLFLANPGTLENSGGEKSHVTDGTVVDNGMGEVVTVDTPPAHPPSTATNSNPPAPAPVVAATKAPVVPKTRKPQPENPRGYSKLSKIPPDPVHTDLTPEAQTALTEKWGKWKFWDGEEGGRPSDDYCAAFPNRDIPGNKFPNNAWQTDAVFVNHYLDAADKLINRAKEAIYTEYGRGKPLPPEGLGERRHMFHWELVDLSTQKEPPDQFQRKGNRGIGGWTTKRSQQGLVRRLLHAMMTSDTFTVVLGGHSAAAGLGNHFRQSYLMQFHKIMAPIFARLGVKLITRNMAQGGMGTVHSSMGSGSIYGDEVDLLIWDSGMTEQHNPDHIDLFMRQGLIGGNRVPVIWGGLFDLLRMLHQEADADVGEFGNGYDGIVEVTSADQAKTIPWAARFLKCNKESEGICHDEPRFCVNCWIDRTDGIKPEANQKMVGQVKWHPGWREHQLIGRVLAFSMLDALQSATVLWGERTMSGQPLDESFWHMTEYYENIRNKVQKLDKSHGDCHKIEGSLPSRMCNTPMKARTQYSPRANYDETSLISIIKKTSDGYVPRNEKVALYDGPDAHNTCFDVPVDGLDVLAIVSSRRRLEAFEQPEWFTLPAPSGHRGELMSSQNYSSLRKLESTIVPGKGWQLFGEPQGLCDGSYYAVCGRSTDNGCLLGGHHDGRGAIIGNEFSGWLVMNIKGVTAGIIVIKLHTWHFESEQTRTAGWTSVNNGEARGRQLEEVSSQGETERDLKRDYNTPPLPDNFVFEYAIDGTITSLKKEEFLEKKKSIHRVVEILTLMDDPEFAKNGARDVEVAVRLLGCGRNCTFGVSHIYWA